MSFIDRELVLVQTMRVSKPSDIAYWRLYDSKCGHCPSLQWLPAPLAAPPTPASQIYWLQICRGSRCPVFEKLMMEAPGQPRVSPAAPCHPASPRKSFLRLFLWRWMGERGSTLFSVSLCFSSVFYCLPSFAWFSLHLLVACSWPSPVVFHNFSKWITLSVELTYFFGPVSKKSRK